MNRSPQVRACNFFLAGISNICADFTCSVLRILYSVCTFSCLKSVLFGTDPDTVISTSSEFITRNGFSAPRRHSLKF